MKIIFDKDNEIKPYIAANAVIIKEESGEKFILLGKRKNVAGHGFWYVPGGHIKLNEKYKESLKREMKEELGVDVEVGNVVWVEENMKDLHHINIYCLVKIVGDQIIKNLEPEKCFEWKWFSLSKPPKKLWTESLKKFLKQYSKNPISINC